MPIKRVLSAGKFPIKIYTNDIESASVGWVRQAKPIIKSTTNLKTSPRIETHHHKNPFKPFNPLNRCT